MRYAIFFITLYFLSTNIFSNNIKIQNTETIPTSFLQNFEDNSEPIKKLLIKALELASKKLGYLYGSATPASGAMDCSGTIYYLLSEMGIKEVPRSSDLIYQWVKEKGHFYNVSKYEFSAQDFHHIQPGDLLFWSGTYEIKRKFDATHVMIYLGKNKAGKPLMIGASNGRTYQSKKIYGVSVFDFQLPNAQSKSKFLGYSCIPNYSC